MRNLFLLIITLMLMSCLQEKPKTINAKKITDNVILVDSNFNCGGSRTQSEADCNLDYICNSVSNIEIRLILNPGFMFGFKVYILANNNNTWNLVEYKYNHKTILIDSIEPVKITKIKSIITAKNLLEALNENNIFTLPDQKDIDIGNNYVDDGAWYTLTFKVGAKYRTYNFNNPDIYKEH